MTPAEVDAPRMTKFGKSMVFTDGRGAGKAGWRNKGQSVPIDPENIYQKDLLARPVQIMQHGQDVRGFLQQGDAIVTILCDGHCGQGHIWAVYACLLGAWHVMDLVDDLKNLVRGTGRTGVSGLTLEETMQKCVADLDKNLRTQCLYTCNTTNGGATMTINVKFPHPRRPYQICSLTTNVGDSPMIEFVRNGRQTSIVEHTLGYNAENTEAARQYNQECVDQGLPTRDVFLGRFNHGAGTKVPWFRDEYGDPMPINVFDIKVVPSPPHLEAKHPNGIVEIHEHPDIKRFYTLAKQQSNWRPIIEVGGCQSYRDRKANLDAQRQGKFTGINWGCTVKGICQTYNAIGDHHSYGSRHGYESVMPVHVSLKVITKPTIEMVCSDGVMDTLSDADLVGCLQTSGQHSGKLAEAIWNKMLFRGKTVKYNNQPGCTYKMFPTTPQGGIKWDDCAMWVQVTIPRKIKKGVRRSSQYPSVSQKPHPGWGRAIRRFGGSESGKQQEQELDDNLQVFSRDRFGRAPNPRPTRLKRYMATNHRRAEAGAVIQPRNRGYNH